MPRDGASTSRALKDGDRPEPVVLTEQLAAGRIAVVTLNRPQALNTLSTELALALSDVFDQLAAQTPLRCAILTGAGTRAFCAGADLTERSGMSTEQWHAQHAIFERAFESLRSFAKPLIAAVNGVAAGGGLELALSADFILAGANARFGQPEVKRGIIPGGGAVQLLPSHLSIGMARQMLMSGELIDAQRGLEIGLVNSIHEPDRLLPAAVAVAEQISANSPAAVRAVKAAITDAVGRPRVEAIERGLAAYRELIDQPDRREGIEAFNQRRPPNFAD